MYNYDFNYGYQYPYSNFDMSDLSGILIIAMGLLLVVLLIAFLYSVLRYIFGAVGLYTIAKNRNLPNPWLAFIPIVNSYLFGHVADDINATMAKRSNYRTILISLSVASFSVSFLSGFFTSISSIFYASLLINGLFLLASIAVSIAFCVFNYIALYKVLREYVPRNAVLLEVLSIVFSIDSFVLFAIRSKKSGYQIWLENNPPAEQEQEQKQDDFSEEEDEDCQQPVDQEPEADQPEQTQDMQELEQPAQAEETEPSVEE